VKRTLEAKPYSIYQVSDLKGGPYIDETLGRQKAGKDKKAFEHLFNKRKLIIEHQKSGLEQEFLGAELWTEEERMDFASAHFYAKRIAYLLLPDHFPEYTMADQKNSVTTKVLGTNIAFFHLPVQERQEFEDSIQQIGLRLEACDRAGFNFFIWNNRAVYIDDLVYKAYFSSFGFKKIITEGQVDQYYHTSSFSYEVNKILSFYPREQVESKIFSPEKLYAAIQSWQGGSEVDRKMLFLFAELYFERMTLFPPLELAEIRTLAEPFDTYLKRGNSSF
jgi:hypothetical protein